MRKGVLVAIVVSLGMALALGGCSKSSSSKKSRPPSLVSAVFTDGGIGGQLGAGDEILITMSKDVSLLGSPAANTVFDLMNGTTLAPSTVISGPTARQVIIQIATGASFQVNGVYQTDPSASGIRVLAGQTALVYGKNNTAVLQTAAVDIQGTLVPPVAWNTVAPMGTARFAHTATLLPNDEILVVGGLHDVASSTNNLFRECLASIEVYDPASDSWTTAADSLVHPRGFHQAVRTPGRDGVIDTNDDYVVIIGGWNSERTDSQGGPRSEGTVEVIVPDWNGDGNTSDLVVNPNASGTAVGTAVADIGTIALPLDASCLDVTVGMGMQSFDVDWAPVTIFGGNNEVAMHGGWVTFQWDDCPSTGPLSSWLLLPIVSGPPTCEDVRAWIHIDDNNDGNLHADSNIGSIGTGGPFTTPYSLQRQYYTHTRVNGTDGVKGTADDTHLVYGGIAFDLTAVCNGNPLNQCGAGDLEWITGLNVQLTGLNPAYATCGIACTAPGVGGTDRILHQAVEAANGELVLLAGDASGANSCASAVEVIDLDFANPAASAIRVAGIDPIAIRAAGQRGALMPFTNSVLLTGGVDLNAGGTTDSAAIVDVTGNSVTAVGAMSEPRGDHAVVSYPASLGVFPEDRVYVFGGVDRSTTFIYVIMNPTMDPAVASSTVEYYRQ